MKKLLIAGEGRNELGRWAVEASYRDSNEAGVLEALLRKVKPEGWKISGGVLWRKIPKYKVGAHRGAETRNVLGLMSYAKDRGFDGVVFSRDRDSEKPEGRERERDVQDGLAAIESVLPGAPPCAGGMAIERLESWLLAIGGAPRSEARKSDSVDAWLSERAVPAKDTKAMVAFVERANLDHIPSDAVSLRAWLDSVRRLLGD